MYISMLHLKNLCEKERNKLVRADVRYGLTGWAPLNGSPHPYNVHLIYIVEENTDLSAYPLQAGMHLLILANKNTDIDVFAKQLPPQINALIIATDDHHDYLMRMQKFFDHTIAMSLLSHSLLEILSFEGGIQAMVDHAIMILGNPIFVFDSSFKLIAANWNEAERHGLNATMIHNRGFSEFEFQLANREHIHERIKRSDQPLLIHHDVLGYDQLIVAIDTDRDLGHVVVDAVNRPFNEMDKKSLWVLKKYIDQQMKKDEFIRNAKGFHYESFLKDLLDEKIATDKMFLDRMQYVGVEFTGNMYCVVIEIARSSSTINPYRIRNQFEGRFSNCKTLIYNGQIVVLLNTPENTMLSKEQIQMAMDICVGNGLYAGMSNCFQDILQLSQYYKQALRSIELGIASINRPTLFLYETYFLEHMKNIFMQKESAKIFCHPTMKVLLDYDKEHHSEMAYTFYMYLLHERNLGATATAMNMHRSSLNYRFKKITTLIGDTFDDAKERQYLMLSYELNKPEM